jgi:hypothetical protein
MVPMPFDFCYLAGESILADDWSAVRNPVRCKIGATNDLKQRLINIRTLQPGFRFHQVWFEAGLGGHIEKLLHSYYRTACVGGELFDLHPSEVEWLTTKAADFFTESRTDCWEPDFEWLMQFDWKEKWRGYPLTYSSPEIAFWHKHNPGVRSTAHPSLNLPKLP